MAVKLQFFSVIIPIEKIEKCKKIGGFKGLIEELEKSKKPFWYDDYLFRDGAMNMGDIDYIIEYWGEQGLIPTIEKNNQKYWNDLCVVDFFNGPTLPCEWLEFVPSDKKERSYVYLKGKSIGKIIGPK